MKSAKCLSVWSAEDNLTRHNVLLKKNCPDAKCQVKISVMTFVRCRRQNY